MLTGLASLLQKKKSPLRWDSLSPSLADYGHVYPGICPVSDTFGLADKYGPRMVIGSIVTIWSLLTALTGAAWNYVSMLLIRLFFGAGKPELSSTFKVVFSWFPVKERG